MTSPRAAALADALDEAIAVQERLLALVGDQRPAIVAARYELVDALASEIEIEVRRLSAVEKARAAAAEAVADELGLAATRWSALRAALGEDDRRALAPRVDRLESLIRDLELANAINGQLVRRELELVDLSVRSLATPDPRTAPRAYTAAGGRAAAPATGPMLLNTAA
jgi:flagellar biosynthesis/type III secretory pathway chaperone